jgi:hypothetical protein
MARLTDYSKWDKLEDSDDENEEAERVRAQPSARQKNPSWQLRFVANHVPTTIDTGT